MKHVLRGFGAPVFAAVVAILIGAIIVVSIGFNPMVVYGSLFSGAFGNIVNIGNTLGGAVPLLLTGLGIAVAFKAGLFNIGAEGQYWVGAIAAVWVGYHFNNLPSILHIILCLVAAMVVGGLWGGIIPGLTKAYVGAHEVITTMMMSYIGINLAKYLIEGGPMQQKGYNPESPLIPQSNWLTTLIPQSSFTTGFIIAVVVAGITWWLLKKTIFGFQLRSVGFNQRASRYAGMNVPLYTILALTISGVFSGLAGGIQMLAVDHRLLDGFSSGYGFTGIVVALLARNNPFGIILSAIFFSALSTGGQNMQAVSGIPSSLTDVLTGLIIFFVAAEELVPEIIRWYHKRRTLKRTSAA